MFHLQISLISGDLSADIPVLPSSIVMCKEKIAGRVDTSYGFGGMFGNIDGNITVYRCSIFSDATINGTHDGGVGGIFGNVVSSATISVLDCLLICNYKITGRDVWFGGIGSNVTGGSVTGNIENCVVFFQCDRYD